MPSTESRQQFEKTSFDVRDRDYHEEEANAEDPRTPIPSAYAIRALIEVYEMERQFQTESKVHMYVVRRTAPDGTVSYHERVSVIEVLPTGIEQTVHLHERPIFPGTPPQYATLIRQARRAAKEATAGKVR